MPANQSLGVGATRRLDTAIREIDVSTGPVVLTLPDNTFVTVAPGGRETFDPPLAGIQLYAPGGARYHVTYETDPVGHEESRRLPGSGSATERAPRQRRKRSTAKSTRTSATKSKSKSKAKAKTKTRKKG
ncbi:MAG TPA: hypothetical protein VF245_12695 [Solirubrobacterales bacterium]